MGEFLVFRVLFCVLVRRRRRAVVSPSFGARMRETIRVGLASYSAIYHLLSKLMGALSEESGRGLWESPKRLNKLATSRGLRPRKESFLPGTDEMPSWHNLHLFSPIEGESGRQPYGPPVFM